MFPLELIPEDHYKKSWSYISQCPVQINTSDSVIAGIDEAGRGPVLGPMVYCAVYVPQNMRNLDNLGVKDSKQLTPNKRMQLFTTLKSCSYVGISVDSIHPADISDKMIYPGRKRNLNQIAHDATIRIIKSMLAQNLNLTEVFIDAVGPSASYKKYLDSIFPTISFTVKEKADSLFPCVSAASICAKVIRDVSLDSYSKKLLSSGIGWGSGYPSDPKTIKYLKTTVDYVFGYPDIVRFSWSTATKLLEEHCAPVISNFSPNRSVSYPPCSDPSIIF